MDWQPIDTAPKGELCMVPVGKTVREMHVAPRILTFTSAGEITVSYWMEKDQRWNMFSAKHPPTHWLPLPPIPSAGES